MWKKVNKSEPMKNSCSWLSNVWKSYVWHAVIRKSMSSNTRSWTFLNMKQKFIYRHWIRYLFSVNFTVFLSVNFSLPWIIRLRRNNPPMRHATERSEDWHLKRRVCRLGFHSIFLAENCGMTGKLFGQQPAETACERSEQLRASAGGRLRPAQFFELHLYI